MAFTGWTIKRLGELEGRVMNPDGFSPPPEGDYVLVIGSDEDGNEMRAEPLAKSTWSQTGVAHDDLKILRYRGRTRGPSIPLPAITDIQAPFALADGQTLTFRVDEGADQVVTFNAVDFVDITAATEFEVGAVLQAQLTGVRVETPNSQVAVYSEKTGPRKGVEIGNGTAAGLNFKTLEWYVASEDRSLPIPIETGEEREITDQGLILDTIHATADAYFSLELGFRNVWTPPSRGNDNLVWLESFHSASDLIISGGTQVDGWRDKSAVHGGTVALPPSAARSPDVLYDTYPKKDGVFCGLANADYLDLALTTPLVQPFTVYLCVSNIVGNAFLFDDATGACFLAYNGSIVYAYAGGGTINSTFGLAGGFNPICVVFDGVNSAIYSPSNFKTPNITGNVGTNGISTFRVGQNAGDSATHDKTFFMFAAFQGADGLGARLQMGDYLYRRFGKARISDNIWRP